MTSPTKTQDRGVTVLLVGRSGNGKSSTGNSILHKKAFQPRASGPTKSPEIELQRDTSTLNGTPVCVVDGPGSGDTWHDGLQDGRSMSDLAEKAFALAGENFTALVLVLKYGVRFTQKEKDFVRIVKDVFGEDVFRKFGIIAMTHGESFDLENKGVDTTFEALCQEHKGDNVRQLFKECDSRVVLFRNKTDDATMKKAQYEQFMDMVSKIQMSQGRPYDKNDFAGAEMGRKKLTVRKRLPQLNKECEDFLNEITERMDQLEQKGHLSPEKVMEELADVRNDLIKFKQYLVTEEGGTGVLQSLLTEVNIQETDIDSMIDLQQRKIQVAADLERKAKPERNTDSDDARDRGYLQITGSMLMKIPNEVLVAFGIALCTGIWLARRY